MTLIFIARSQTSYQEVSQLLPYYSAETVRGFHDLLQSISKLEKARASVLSTKLATLLQYSKSILLLLPRSLIMYF